MAYKLVIAREAQGEYRAIVGYLATTLGSSQTARHFMDEFDAKVGLIGQQPEAFDLCHLPELVALGYRSVAVMRYTVLYKIAGDEVVIAHIFHQSQDYARLV
ncbi:MAG: type II toxin-antitoxin system RelE/ParE family toxin [Coriobacteriia bacterium]|nr:type II toxin-antitoxin system RelE/ParE family toxin [Coriobacteriia bacterium]